MCLLSQVTKKTLVVDSSKRLFPSENANDFRCEVSPSLRNISACQLENFYVPLSWYNIYGSRARMIITYGSNYEITLPDGLYTNVLSFLKAVENAINDAIEQITFTITFDQNTGRVTLSSTEFFIVVYTKGGLAEILGLTATTTDIGSHTFNNMVKLPSLHRYLKLQIEGLDGEVHHINNAVDSTTFIIPLPPLGNHSVGELVKADLTETDRSIITFKSPRNLKQFRVYLYDQDGIMLDLHGLDYYFTVSCISI